MVLQDSLRTVCDIRLDVSAIYEKSITCLVMAELYRETKSSILLTLLPLVCQVQSFAAVGLPSANVTVALLVLLGCDLYDHRGSSDLPSPP